MRQGQPGSVILQSMIKDIQRGITYKGSLVKVVDEKELNLILRSDTSELAYFARKRSRQINYHTNANTLASVLDGVYGNTSMYEGGHAPVESVHNTLVD